MRGKRVSPAPWISVGERLPVNQKDHFFKTLATDGKDVYRAVHVRKHEINVHDMSFDGDTDYDDSTEEEYWPEGWYEWNRYEETHWSLGETTITHWMPLPNPPEVPS